MVATRLRVAGLEVPPDGWPRLQVALSAALNVRPTRITTGSRLYADLGMIHGVE